MWSFAGMIINGETRRIWRERDLSQVFTSNCMRTVLGMSIRRLNIQRECCLAVTL
jgi:hypothetical protein